MGQNGTLSSKQLLAVAALCHGRTQEQAASEAGCSRSSLTRWLADPAFTSAIADARRETYRRSVSTLVSASASAVHVLLKIAGDSKTPPAARVSAARGILDCAHRGFATVELEQRISQLEESANHARA